MAATFDNPALLHDDDAVGMAHGAEPMGDHQRGAAGCDLVEGALDRGLGFVVHGCGGLIEDQHRWIFEDGAGQGDPLALTAREPLAPFAHHRVEAVRQGLDEGGRFRQLGRPFDRQAGGLKAAVGDVFGHRAVKQKHLLTHQADAAAQILQAQAADRQAIEQNLACLDLIEAQQQLNDRAFT